MKKYFFYILSFVIIFATIGPELTSANSNEAVNIEVPMDSVDILMEEIDTNELEAEIVEDFGVNESDNVDVLIEEVTQDKIQLNTELITEKVEAETEIDINVNTGELGVSGTIIDEQGDITEQDLSVFVQEVTGEDYIATIVDNETGEVFEVDSTQFQAAVLPAVVVYIIVRMGLNYAIKTLGKKAIQGYITGYTRHGLAQAIGRDGGRGVATSAINSAIKNPTKIIPQANGVLRYENSNAVVVLNKYGKVITTWAKTSSAWR